MSAPPTLWIDGQALSSNRLFPVTFSLDFISIFLYEEPIASGDFPKPIRDIPGSITPSLTLPIEASGSERLRLGEGREGWG